MEDAKTVAATNLKLDLIGIHEQESKEGDKFWNLSFRLGANRIATTSMPTGDNADKIIEAHNNASANGEALIFEASNATVAVATEIDEETNETVPVVRGNTRYYRLASADVEDQLAIKLVNKRPRGTVISL